MKKFRRLFHILYVIGRYRLDEILPPQYRSRTLKLILLPFKFQARPHEARGKNLRHALEDLGPIFIKFGQLLSTRPDVIPHHLVVELDQLQDNVRPFPGEDFKRLVEKSLNAPLAHFFTDVSDTPLASASIAQVHTAKLINGDDVVIKAVRPGILHTIECDVALMDTFAKALEWINPASRRLKPTEVVNEYRQVIFDELNLMRETANASQLKRNFSDSQKLYVPQVYWEYSRDNVMVMERIYGAQVTDLVTLKENNVDLKVLAETGVEIFFTQVFEHNFFHADMHPGNVYVSLKNPKKPNYIALDMAIMGSLTREDQYYLARNLLAMFRRDYRQVAELHVLSGWVPKNTSVSAFESAIRAVGEPIFEKPLKDISFGVALMTLFQTAQRFEMEVQPQLVLLQKTLLNIEGLGRQLYPDLDLWQTAHPFLESWLKQRFHPKQLFRELRRQAPEWMEKFPEVPHLIFDTAQKVKELAEAAPEIQAASTAIAKERKNKKQRTIKRAIAALAFGGAILLSAGEIANLSTSAITLLGIGVIALLAS